MFYPVNTNCTDGVNFLIFTAIARKKNTTKFTFPWRVPRLLMMRYFINGRILTQVIGLKKIKQGQEITSFIGKFLSVTEMNVDFEEDWY